MPRKPAQTLTWNGKTKSFLDWAMVTGLSADAIRSRLKEGWTVEKALTTKPLSRGKVAQRAAEARWNRTQKI